jgi:uncharacterized protein YbjT (DUF2867 family)
MKTIFVSGATGQQGGAVVCHLLQQPDVRIRALTRNPASRAAQAVKQRGVELVQGDLDEPASFRQALEGVDGVFSVQNFLETGYDREIAQGKQLADAARAAGVRHFVYSSVVSADKRTGLPHFESKWQIEQHLHQIGLTCTVLRPAFFMQNWYGFLREPILNGTLPLPLDPQTRLQQISVDDIGAFAAMAFGQPDRWSGRTIELAGDELTVTQVAAVLSRVLGRRVDYVQLPWDQFEQSAGEEMTRMYRWFNDVGYHVDIAALRRECAALSTLEQALRQMPWATPAARKAA